jgi:hypothetical protein
LLRVPGTIFLTATLACLRQASAQFSGESAMVGGIRLEFRAVRVQVRMENSHSMLAIYDNL